MSGFSALKNLTSGAAMWTTSSFLAATTVAPDGDTLHLYYGAADSSIALATGSIRAILDRLEETGQKDRLKIPCDCL